MVEIIKNEIRDSKRIFWCVTTGIVISLGLYVFFVGHTIYNTVLRGQAEQAITTLQNSMSEKEARYLSLKNKVTVEMAEARGFKSIAASAKFIPRKPSGTTLSLNTRM